jgi:hypothetical protein
VRAGHSIRLGLRDVGKHDELLKTGAQGLALPRRAARGNCPHLLCSRRTSGQVGLPRARSDRRHQSRHAHGSWP